MNSSIRSSCKKGADGLRRLVSTCNDAMESYRRSMSVAQNTAKKFKDEDGYIAEKRAEHAATARQTIYAADKEAAECIREVQAELRKAVAEHIAMPPRKEFVELLRAYKDFQIPMTRGELDALIRSAGGNYFSQRALYTVAKDNGWEITCPDADAYDKVLNGFNNLLEPPFSYAAESFTKEATEIYKGDYNNKTFGAIMRRSDGSTYRNGVQIDFLYLFHAQSAVEGTVKQLEEIAEEWGRDFVPSIVAYKKDAQEAGFDGAAAETQAAVMQAVDTEVAASRVQVKDNAAVEAAQRIGAARSKANAEAKKVLEAYTDK